MLTLPVILFRRSDACCLSESLTEKLHKLFVCQILSVRCAVDIASVFRKIAADIIVCQFRASHHVHQVEIQIISVIFIFPVVISAGLEKLKDFTALGSSAAADFCQFFIVDFFACI